LWHFSDMPTLPMNVGFQGHNGHADLSA